MNNKWLLPLILFLAALAGFYLFNKYRVAPEISLSSLVLSDLAGNPVKPDIKGKKTVVCFAASWCGSCIKELNEIKSIKEEKLSDVEVIVISDESPEMIARFRDRKQYPFTFYRLGAPFSSIGIHSIPVSYIFDQRGALKKETVGYVDWKDPSTVNHLLKLME